MKRRTAWIVLLVANVLCYCVLSFYQKTDAAPPTRGGPPFANAVQQRMEMIQLLQEIRGLMQEQNALLRSANQKAIGNGLKGN